MGAGASTAAGIPDFRSPTGLWAQEKTRDLLSGLEGFFGQPSAVFQKFAELFLGRAPTKVHALLARLAAEGMLQRVYTQNIDGLERVAGIPSELVIECHGNALQCVCSSDRNHAVCQDLGCVCKSIAEAGNSGIGSNDAVPRCSCGAILRPDVIFFGEPLPPAFSKHAGEDLASCDLLIVIGTALSVYPVAGLVNRVPALTPRLLLNRDAVGAWKACEGNAENYRDVFYGGDCQEGAMKFASMLGWTI